MYSIVNFKYLFILLVIMYRNTYVNIFALFLLFIQLCTCFNFNDAPFEFSDSDRNKIRTFWNNNVCTDSTIRDFFNKHGVRTNFGDNAPNLLVKLYCQYMNFNKRISDNTKSIALKLNKTDFENFKTDTKIIYQGLRQEMDLLASITHNDEHLFEYYNSSLDSLVKENAHIRSAVNELHRNITILTRIVDDYLVLGSHFNELNSSFTDKCDVYDRKISALEENNKNLYSLIQSIFEFNNNTKNCTNCTFIYPSDISSFSAKDFYSGINLLIIEFDKISNSSYNDTKMLINTLNNLFNYSSNINSTNPRYKGIFGNIIYDLLSGLREIFSDIASIFAGALKDIFEALIQVFLDSLTETIKIWLPLISRVLYDMLSKLETVLDLIVTLLESLLLVCLKVILIFEDKYFLFEYSIYYIIIKYYTGHSDISLIILALTMILFGVKRTYKSFYLALYYDFVNL